jgi:hypothetical protein
MFSFAKHCLRLYALGRREQLYANLIGYEKE